MEIAKMIIMGIISFFIVLNIHELGHTLVGLYQGFRFEFMVIGPLGIKRSEKGGITFYFEKNISFWGGCAATIPSDKKGVMAKFARVVIAGPITSLIFGALIGVIYVYIKVDMLLMIAAMSLGIGATTLIPFQKRTGGFYSDGRRYLRIRDKGKSGYEEVATMNIVQEVMINGNYRGIELEDINTLKSSIEAENRYIGSFFEYHRNNDLGNKEEAEIILIKLDRQKAEVSKSFLRVYGKI